MKYPKFFFFWGLILLVISLGLAACGDNPAETPSPEAATATPLAGKTGKPLQVIGAPPAPTTRASSATPVPTPAGTGSTSPANSTLNPGASTTVPSGTSPGPFTSAGGGGFASGNTGGFASGNTGGFASGNTGGFNSSGNGGFGAAPGSIAPSPTPTPGFLPEMVLQKTLPLSGYLLAEKLFLNQRYDLAQDKYETLPGDNIDPGATDQFRLQNNRSYPSPDRQKALVIFTYPTRISAWFINLATTPATVLKNYEFKAGETPDLSTLVWNSSSDAVTYKGNIAKNRIFIFSDNLAEPRQIVFDLNCQSNLAWNSSQKEIYCLAPDQNRLLVISLENNAINYFETPPFSRVSISNGGEFLNNEGSVYSLKEITTAGKNARPEFQSSSAGTLCDPTYYGKSNLSTCPIWSTNGRFIAFDWQKSEDEKSINVYDTQTRKNFNYRLKLLETAKYNGVMVLMLDEKDIVFEVSYYHGSDCNYYLIDFVDNQYQYLNQPTGRCYVFH